MNPLTLANALANLIVVVAVLDVSFRVFGRPDHPIHNDKTMLIARKTVSSIVICGAISNLVTLSTPSWTEILLNVGFAGNYLFSSLYDRRFTNPSNTNLSRKVPKLRSSGGPGRSGSSKKNSASGGNRGKRASAR